MEEVEFEFMNSSTAGGAMGESGNGREGLTESSEVRKIFEELMEEVEQSNLLSPLTSHQLPQTEAPVVYFENDITNNSSYYEPPVNNLINPLAIKLEKIEQPATPTSLPPQLHSFNELNLSSSSVSTPLLASIASSRAECSHTLSQLAADLDRIFVELQQLHQNQLSFLLNGAPSLGEIHAELLKRIDSMIKQLDFLTCNVVLLPSELQQRDDMTHAADILRKRITLYKTEYDRRLSNDADDSPIATLMIVKQPFPSLVLQQQQILPESLEVQLFTGVHCPIMDGGEVEALLQGENLNTGGRAKKRKAQMGVPVTPSTKMLENQVHTMKNNVANMPVKFLLSSEKKLCHLKFVLRSRNLNNGEVLEIESESSNPLFILCHQNQFAYCEGELLKKEAFGSNIMPIPWPKLANCLQRQFLRTMRQAERNEEHMRPLSMLDLSYIHQKRFDGSPKISMTHFDKFWEWYGKFLHMFRYQRHISRMWWRGLILPFIGRETADSMLGKKPGTFLIRPSDPFPGQLVISYISPHGANQHYLVSHEDVAKKSLASFVIEKNLLSVALQFDYKALEKAWIALSDVNGLLQEVPGATCLSVSPVAKTSVFSEFCRTKAKFSEKEEEEEEAARYQRDPSLLTGQGSSLS
eukprot:TRINITY_DN900_c0_g4_i1.p1 TRINITY_DN900_c0_g4~~TRINITY_DN900_c0_g4_i1.p1  ORF type:complete len:638 (-),score=115.22 TRINITY_DN900_c0_g4_i1:79-1992(-)